MARIFTAGNELADPTKEGWYWDETTTYAAVSQLGGYRSVEQNGGRYYYYVPQNWDLIHHPGIFGKPTFPTANAFTELYVRFHFQSGAPGVSGERAVFSLLGQNNQTLFTGAVYDSGGADTPTGFYGVRFRETTTGTVRLQVAGVAQSGTWNLLEFRLRLGAGGTGEMEIRVNEVVVGSLSGTFVGPSGETVMSGVQMRNTQNTGATRINLFDNWAVNDTTGTVNNSWPGQGYTILRVPQRDGGTTELTTDLGTSGVDNANRLGVDDYRPSAENDLQWTTAYSSTKAYKGGNSGDVALRPQHPGFVYPTAVPQKDLYTISDLPFDAGLINAISVFSQARSKVALSGNIRHLLKPLAQSEIQGGQIAIPSDALDPQATHFNENPNTGVAFTPDEVNDLELGIQFET